MAEDIGWRKYAGRFRTFPKLVNDPCEPGVRMVVCIPICAEPDVLTTLDSIYHAHRIPIKTEVILLFNRNIRMSEEEISLHRKSWSDCETWVQQHHKTGLKYLPVFVDELPDPKGGVGWARKMAMDEAARRLEPDGVILCLDADSTLSENYFDVVDEHFREFKTQDAVSISYEHKIDGLNSAHKQAIVLYELHLRYLVNAQQWCGHPFASQTIGSAMAVRRKAYMDQGGMNTRNAGEDFYFLQKFIEIGTHGEIRNTTVYPSARISSRVPFGTGRAMQQILKEGETWQTTDFKIFSYIKPLFQAIDQLREICSGVKEGDPYEKLLHEIRIQPEVVSYLRLIGFLEECALIYQQTSSLNSFKRRFFRYFNAFRMMKYMHYMSDHHFPDVSVLEAAASLANELKPTINVIGKEDIYLKLFRSHDRQK